MEVISDQNMPSLNAAKENPLQSSVVTAPNLNYYLQKDPLFHGFKENVFLTEDHKNNFVHQHHSFSGKKKTYRTWFVQVNKFATADCDILSVKKYVPNTR